MWRSVVVGIVALHGCTVWILAGAESREVVELAEGCDSGNVGAVRRGFEYRRRNLDRIPTLNRNFEAYRTVLSDGVVVPLPWGRRFNEVGISDLVWDARIGAAPHGFSSNGRA